MYISPTERMKKIHIWIGTTKKNEEEYEKYFDQEIQLSKFSQDIGLDTDYDEDFIGIIPLLSKEEPVGEILKEETPIHPSEIPLAVEKCIAFEINNANAVFYLTDSTIKINNIGGKYNDLTYIGIFNSSL